MFRYRMLGILSFFCVLAGYGQVTVGRITGTVTDQTGAAIVGIPVSAEESSSGTKRCAYTGYSFHVAEAFGRDDRPGTRPVP